MTQSYLFILLFYFLTFLFLLFLWLKVLICVHVYQIQHKLLPFPCDDFFLAVANLFIKEIQKWVLNFCKETTQSHWFRYSTRMTPESKYKFMEWKPSPDSSLVDNIKIPENTKNNKSPFWTVQCTWRDCVIRTLHHWVKQVFTRTEEKNKRHKCIITVLQACV